ncbi:MAG: PKD domain-containing protein [Saprospiraceae bacterium]
MRSRQKRFINSSWLRTLICILLTIPVSISYSRHIIGSDFYYECKGAGRATNTKTYELSLTIYRDCSNPAGSGYDPDASFGIYRFNGTRYIYVTQFIINHGSISKIKPDNNPCLIIPPNVCVEESNYSFAVDLPVIDETYVIYYMRCCRNNTIINLIAPNNTGATFFIEITPEAQKTCNNSPRFKFFPPIVICADFPFEVDQGAADNESDSLIYEFCTPYAGGGNGAGDPTGQGVGCGAVRPNPQICAPPFQFVDFAPPFNTEEPMGKGVLILDRFTGKLSGRPTDLGQYVVGICVKEFRNGILIGSIHRDFQFNIGICEQTVSAKIQSDTSIGKRFTVNYCGDRMVPFINESERKEYIRTYDWEFKSKSKPNNPLITNTDRDATILFPEPGEYTGLMIVNKNAIICSDTAYVDLNIIPSDIKADFDFTYDKCSSLPVQFKDKSFGVQTPIKTWKWDFMDGEIGSGKNSNHLFKKPGNYPVKLIVTDGKICKSEIVKNLVYFPAPEVLDVLPDKFRACVPANIHFQNLSLPLDTSYQVDWDFGDGTHSAGLHADHTYDKPGSYSIAISIKAPSGCVSKETFPAFVKVQEGPDADFTYNPEIITTLKSVVNFSNQSKGAISYSWNFGDNSVSAITNPIHHYTDTGKFNIVLVALHENGCIDTASKTLEVLLNISYFLPNAFSPNNDGVNDIYVGNGAILGMQDFKMSIYNRWGEVVFLSEDPFGGWNGRKQNNGPVEPNGVYICVVQYKTDKGESREVKSFATLVR